MIRRPSDEPRVGGSPRPAFDDLLRSITAETAAGLDRLDELPAPRRRRALLLLALEREQVVDILYSDSRIAALIARLDADPATVDAVRRAILWIHRDEALHAQYVRGRLLRDRGPRRAIAAASIFATQAVGAVGGWCSAVSRRGDDDAFGLRALAARAAFGAGELVGRVPRGLGQAASFDDVESFCRLSATLEGAAITAYERLLPLLDPGDRSTFERIVEDERRHREVFGILAEVVDVDAIGSHVTAARLCERLARVSPWLVDCSHRRGEAASPLGSRADVHAIDRRFDGARDLDRDVDGLLASAGIDDVVRPGARVAIRTSFMLGYHAGDRSNIVSPAVVRAIAIACHDRGAVDVAIVESPTVYDRFFGRRSVSEVARYFGFVDPSYRVVDGSGDLRRVDFARGLATTEASGTWLDADVRVVLAKPCGDPEEVAHGALATMPGLTGRLDEQVYTNRLVDHRTAALMLLDVAPPDLAVLDLWGPVGDGPLGVMGCRRPSEQRRLYAGRDAIAVDAAVVGDIGADPRSSAFIRRADDWFGTSGRTLPDGSRAGPLVGFRAPQASAWWRAIAATAAPVYFHLSLRGRLFVPEFDSEAFPPIDDPGPAILLVRRVTQVVFGLRPARPEPFGQSDPDAAVA